MAHHSRREFHSSEEEELAKAMAAENVWEIPLDSAPMVWARIGRCFRQAPVACLQYAMQNAREYEEMQTCT